MTKAKRYRCDGCDEMIPADDVVTYYGTLAHEYVGDEGDTELCGTVRALEDSSDSSKGAK